MDRPSLPNCELRPQAWGDSRRRTVNVVSLRHNVAEQLLTTSSGSYPHGAGHDDGPARDQATARDRSTARDATDSSGS